MRKAGAVLTGFLLLFLVVSRILGNPYDFELERIFWEEDPKTLSERLERFERDNSESGEAPGLSTRIAEWIRGRVSPFLPRSRTEELEEKVEEANRRYLYLDTAGPVDPAGDPLLRTTEGLYGNEGDLSLWERELLTERERLLEVWKTEAEAAARRWMAGSGLAEDVRFTEGLEAALGISEEDVERELRRIYEQERSRFLFARLRDTFSLRKRTEEELAGPVGDVLLTEGYEDSRSLLDELEADLEALLEAATEGTTETGRPVSPEEALTELARWGEVERRFLEARSLWETESRDRWREFDAGWNGRLGEYWRRKNEWNEEFERLCGRTAELYEGRRGELLEERERALLSLEESLILARSELTRELEAVTEPLFDSYRILESIHGDPAAEESFGRECRETIRQLESDLDRIVRDITGLGREGPGEDTFPDSFSHDLAAFRTVEEHLREQLTLAEAVLDYAESDSSDRPRRAETLSRYESARLAYDEGLSALERFEDRLSEVLFRTAATEARIEELTKQAESARGRCSEARAVYEERLEVYRLENSDILREMTEEVEASRNEYLLDHRRGYARDYFEAREGRIRSSLLAERERSFETFFVSRYGPDGLDIESLEALAREAEAFVFDPADPPGEEDVRGWVERLSPLRLDGPAEELLSAYTNAVETPPGSERDYRYARAADAAHKLKQRVLLEYDAARILRDMLFESSPEEDPSAPTAADRPARSEEELRLSGLELYLKRARFEKAVLTGEAGDFDEAKIGAARDLVRFLDPLLLAPATASAAAADLEDIILCLDACVDGSPLPREFRGDLLLDFLDGQDPLTFRDLDLVEFFLAEEYREHNRKTVAALLEGEYGPLLPQRDRKTALQGDITVLVESLRGDIEDHDGASGRLESTLALGVNEDLPRYIADLLVLNAGTSLPGSGITAELGRLEEAAETFEEILAAAEGALRDPSETGRETDPSAQALVGMLAAGSAGAESALRTAAAYEVLLSGCTAEEALARLYSDLLSGTGEGVLPPVEAVEGAAARLEEVFETVDTARYHPYLDGGPGVYAAAVLADLFPSVPSADLKMDRLLIELRIRQGSAGPVIGPYLSEALALLMEETGEELARTRAGMELLSTLREISAAKASGEPSLIAGFYVGPEAGLEDLLAEALEVWALPEGTVPEVTSAEARERGESFFALEARVLDEELRLRELTAADEALSRGAETYYLAEVEPALREYTEAAEEYRRIDDEVQSHLRILEEVRTGHEEILGERAETLGELEEARMELLTAEALYRYAREGYDSSLYSPREEYERLREEVDTMTRLIGILEEVSGMSDSLDPEYRHLTEGGIRALSLLDTVHTLRKEYDRTTASKAKELGELHARLIETSGELFELPESIDYSGGVAEAAETTPLSGSGCDQETLWGFVRDFDGLRNPDLWLRNAGLLLWRDLAKGPTPVGIENDQMLKKLIELIDFDADAYLESRASLVSRSQARSTLFSNYSFLFEKGGFSPRPGFHDLDLTGMIVDTVKGRAETAAADFDDKATSCTITGIICAFTFNPVMAAVCFGLAIDYSDRAGKIRELNEEVHAPSGASGRARFIGRVDRIRDLQLRYLNTREILEILRTGNPGDGGVTREGFASFLAVLGISEGSEKGTELLEYFGMITEENRTDPETVLDRIRDRLGEDGEALTAAADERAWELDGERNLLRNELRELLGAEVIDWDTLTEVCSGLYGSDRFDPEDRLLLELELLHDFAPESLEGRRLLLERTAALTLELHRLEGAGRRESCEQGFDLNRELLLRREREAELRLSNIHDSGRRDWTVQYHRLLQSREEQHDSFYRTCRAGEREWDLRWTRLLANRNDAIRGLLGGTGGSGDGGVSNPVEIFTPPLPDTEIGETVGYDSHFHDLKESFIDTGDLPVRGSIPPGPNPLPGSTNRLRLFELARRTDELTEKLRRHLLSVEAAEAERIYREYLGTLEDRIRRADDEVDTRISSVLISSGYRREGTGFHRNSVVDKTLLEGTEKIRHTLEGYRRFVLPFEIPSPLEEMKGIMHLSSEAVKVALKRAGETLSAYTRLIFGSGDDSPPPSEGVAAEHIAYFHRLRGSLARLIPKSAEKPEGLFSAHVGAPPETDEEDPEVFVHRGFGELGRIFTRYYRFEIDLGRGLSRLSQVWYDQRLWDDDADNDGEADSWFAAPTARGIIDFVFDAVLNFIVPGGGYILSMADDLAFSMADVSAGRSTFDEILFSLGTKMLTRFAGSGIDTFLGDVQEAAAEAAAGSFERISSAVILEGTSAGLTNLSSGLIGGLSYTSGEGFDFRIETLRSYLYGREAVSGYISSGLGAGITAGLEGMRIDLPESWEILDGYDLGIDFGGIREFNHALGRILGAAGAYLITGGTTVNILNLRDVGRFFGAGEGFTDQGLLELHLGDSPYIAIGGEGTDVSVTALGVLMRGLGETVEMIRTERDVSRAYDIIEAMQSVTDRVIGRGEYRFSGGSNAADILASLLECRRKEISSGNLYELFAGLTPASERHADENLMLAFSQGDLGVYEFLADEIFHSRGSFLLAHYLFREGVIGLEEMVDSGKIYAGTESPGSVTLPIRERLLSDYFAQELAASGELLGGVVDPKEFLMGKILDGGGSSLAEELSVLAEARDRECLLYANLPGCDERTLTHLLAAYTESIMAVHALGIRPPSSVPPNLEVLQSYAGPGGVLFAPVRDSDEKGIRITCGYGYRLIDESLEGVITGEPYGWAEHEHRAVDIAVSPGGEYYAITDGTLGLVWDDDKGLGIELYVKGRDDQKFVYWHGDPNSVQDIGKAILNTGSPYLFAGTPIGRSGDTGASTGPHLHLEYYDVARYEDPLNLLKNAEYFLDPYAQYLSGYDQKYGYGKILNNIDLYGQSSSPYSNYAREFRRKHMREIYKEEWERTVGSAF